MEQPDRPHNPYLNFEDPFDAQKKQLEEIQKEQMEFERLCFEVFHMNAQGKQLYELIKERYLDRSLFAPTHANAPELALYYEGFKEAFRGVYTLGLKHLKRINAGKK